MTYREMFHDDLSWNVSRWLILKCFKMTYLEMFQDDLLSWNVSRWLILKCFKMTYLEMFQDDSFFCTSLGWMEHGGLPS